MSRLASSHVAATFLVALLVVAHGASGNMKKGAAGHSRRSLARTGSMVNPGTVGDASVPITNELSPSPPPHADWPSYPALPPDSPVQESEDTWAPVLDLSKDAGYGLGLHTFISFLEDVVPSVADILRDTPTAVFYLQRIFKYGVPQGQPGSGDHFRNTLFNITQPTIAAIVATDTGSLAAERVMMEQQVDLIAAASASDWTELINALNTGVWADLNDDYAPATLGLTVLNVLKGMVVYTLSPVSRLSLPQLVMDIVTSSLALVENVLNMSDALRTDADSALRMTDDEWAAYTRLQTSLTGVRDALFDLDKNLRA